MSEMLTEAKARYWGASCAEEVIQTVCDGCKKANLDFSGPDFCPIQTRYGVDGDDEHIQCYEVTKDGMERLRVWCTEYEGEDDE